jgi:tetratricopeptide (TPR) repeat protein
VWALAFSPDGATLVSGGKDSILNAWSPITATLKEGWPLDEPRKTLGLAFAPDGATFAAANGNGTVDLWRVAKSTTRAALPVPTIVPRQIASNATPEQRAYSQAMDLMDHYAGDRAQLDQAEAALQEIQRVNPRSALAYCGLGRLAYKRGFIKTNTYDPTQLAAALDLESKAIAVDPTFADAYVVRGWVTFESKDAVGARTDLAAALKLAPASPRALALAAAIAVDHGDVDGAEKILRDVLSRPVEAYFASSAFVTLGDIYWGLGDFEASEQARRRDIDLEPESAGPREISPNFSSGKATTTARLPWRNAPCRR